ncbi:MAG: penicillin acylase family protein, partial [Deltaproteobacteria bacterium]|nr:penicillin acylase family protein [Deltaproteobacteria bacterium]
MSLIVGLSLGASACRDDGPAAVDDDDGGTSTGEGSTAGETGASGSGTDGADDTTSGQVDPDGVSVFRDEHGVPHVVAATDAGAMYGLGWATAEDRLAQITVTVLSAQGRLAEHFGPTYVEHDVRMRTLGHWRHAQHMESVLPQEPADLLAAYAQGINDFVAANPQAGAQTMASLGIEPQTWTPAHSLAVWYRVSDLFTSDPLGKAVALEEFEQLVGQVGLDEAIEQTVGTVGPGQPSAGVVQAADVPSDVVDAIEAYAESMGYGQAAMAPPHHYGHLTPKFSHAWVVGGERTTSGRPALVSDPQVAVSSPNFLYEWAVVGDQLHARGSSPAGIPGLLIGYTPTTAWGMTAAGLDQRDLFRLQMTDPTHYVIDGVEHALDVSMEIVEVAGGNARQVQIRDSEWGPVITSLLPAAVQGEYALKGLPFAVTDRDPFTAMVGMMRATDLDGLRASMVEWTTPSANFVAADAQSIFYTLVGDIPLRSPMSPLGGMIAQDGSSLAYDWVDLIPNEYKPWVLDPADGYILSANHRPAGAWYPLPLGTGTGGRGDTLRSRRLRELIEALPPLVEPAAVLDDVQWDCINAGRRDQVAIGMHVVSVAPGQLSAAATAALEALGAWHVAGGSMRTDQPGVFLANHINIKFRFQQTGQVLH